MLDLSDAALSVLGGTYRSYLAVESWLDGQLLADSIPVSAASEEVDRTLKVPERVTLTVPRVDALTGIEWTPVDYSDPLAANGQRLRVQLGVDIGNGVVEWFTRGWYLIEESGPSEDGGEIDVTAVGLLTLVDEARMITPLQPSGTLVDTIRGLVEPAVTVVVDTTVTDRNVPAGINYSDDRLQAVLDLLDAWPATGRVAADGYLHVTSATQSTTPVLSLTDGQGGTVITAVGSSTRDGGYNVVVAQGTDSDGNQVQGVATLSFGPRALGGTFSPLPVPYFYSSPLLTTNAQCNAAAQTVLARLQRTGTIGFTITMVPHLGLEAGDVVSITTGRYTDLLCTVEQLTLPWTADGGSQTLTVRSLT